MRLLEHWGWEGPRGEGWLVPQALLLAAFLLAPRLGEAWPVPLRWLGLGLGVPLTLAGGGLGLAGALALGRQLTPLPRPTSDGVLVEHGPYRLVRHPIYSGVCLAALGLALLTAHTARLGLAIGLALFFDRKARREEAWLSDRWPGYAAYRQRVRRLVPWLY
jgi:protein-S-isoprenylcysteine O-methyltransferase Ste14